VHCLLNPQERTVARAVAPIARNFRMLGSYLLNAVGVPPFLQQLIHIRFDRPTFQMRHRHQIMVAWLPHNTVGATLTLS